MSCRVCGSCALSMRRFTSAGGRATQQLFSPVVRTTSVESLHVQCQLFDTEWLHLESARQGCHAWERPSKHNSDYISEMHIDLEDACEPIIDSKNSMSSRKTPQID